MKGFDDDDINFLIEEMDLPSKYYENWGLSRRPINLDPQVNDMGPGNKKYGLPFCPPVFLVAFCPG